LRNINLIILSSLFIVSSCGGGGGGGGGDSSPATPPGPIINFNSSPTSVITGETLTLTWSTSNATSCSASGSWSGDKATSGNETIIVTKSGSLNFVLTCSSSSSSSSKTVSVSVNPVLNAYAYIDGPTTFSGFYIYKRKGIALRMKSVTVDMDINDQESLYITRFRYSEDRYLAGFNDDNGNSDRQGVRLGESFNIDENGDQKTYYIPQISEAFHSSNQIILNTNNQINPYTYEGDTLDDLEIFNADITLEFDPEYIYTNSHNNIKMSVMAFPKENENTFNAYFIGTSSDSDSYTFLYLVDKRFVDDNSNNLPSESDIFDKNLLMVNLYTSFMSQPNIVPITENGFRTKTEIAQVNNTGQLVKDTLNGARLADAIDITTNETLGLGNSYAIKYLQPDESSTQRVFLKTSLRSDSLFTNDCLAPYNPYRGCDAINWQLYFFTPDKEGLVGLILGGYFTSSELTNARLLIDND
tara:strand:+ start:94 stop:1506 length:1413 start_codon:yes stop_codon:yes gene_type:complete